MISSLELAEWAQYYQIADEEDAEREAALAGVKIRRKAGL